MQDDCTNHISLSAKVYVQCYQKLVLQSVPTMVTVIRIAMGILGKVSQICLCMRQRLIKTKSGTTNKRLETL